MDEAVFDSSSPSNSDDEEESDCNVSSNEDCELDDIIDAVMAGGSAVSALRSAAGDHASTDPRAVAEGLAGADSGVVLGSLSPAAGADGKASAGPTLHLKPAPRALSGDNQAADEASADSSSSVRSSPAASRAGSVQGSYVGSLHSSGQGAGSIGSSRALSLLGHIVALEHSCTIQPLTAVTSRVAAGQAAAIRLLASIIRPGVQVRLQASTAKLAVVLANLQQLSRLPPLSVLALAALLTQGKAGRLAAGSAAGEQPPPLAAKTQPLGALHLAARPASASTGCTRSTLTPPRVNMLALHGAKASYQWLSDCCSLVTFACLCDCSLTAERSHDSC